MELTDLWFVIIAVLFTGYFVLEGFDFGVGMLLGVLARGERERRVLINTIGPVWDGNEVWVVTAGGAMFAAFPHWYATVFSGFYLPLLGILAALIVRNVAFEFRGKRPGAAWRRRWDRCVIIGSLIPAALWGVVFGNLVHGVPLDDNHDFAGTTASLLNPYALLGGLATLVLFAAHGAVFVALKTTGEVRARANRFVSVLGIAAAAVTAVFLMWTVAHRFTAASAIAAGLAVAALAAGLLASRGRREGWAFVGTAAAVALAVAALFANLYPDLLPSTTGTANTLTVAEAASTPYTLRIMSWTALVFTPVVLLYQGWTYWVFRRRVSVHHIPGPQETPTGTH